jgi:hypothetical protein
MLQGIENGNQFMPIQDLAGVRPLETSDDLDEARLEAVGFIFHGMIPQADAKRGSVKAGTNLLHFARCAKLDKAGDGEAKVWFRTITIAKEHLDESVGSARWKWCKICEREITQKILNER